MKSPIVSIAALGLASSTSGAILMCQFDDQMCLDTGKNCFEILLTEGCHDLTPIFAGAAFPKYQATLSDDRKQLSFNAFHSNICAPSHALLLSDLPLEREKCFEVRYRQGFLKSWVSLKWDDNMVVTATSQKGTELSMVATATSQKGTELSMVATATSHRGAGLFVVPSLIASVATVILGLLL